MQHSLSLEANSYSAGQEISSHFMEPEGSLPCSQETATASYREFDESSSHSRTQILEDPSPY
jgi:hypothetical protein